MKSIRFIRHAESAANAGLPTSDPNMIPLTGNGKKAAERAALEYNWPAPDLIVVSPYLRARQTAEPFIAKFQNAKVESWPVQEFTYICAEKCIETTFAERKPMVEAYWEKALPDYVDGPGAESFREFVARALGSLAKLRRREEENVLVICHGILMQAIEFYQKSSEDPADPDSMRRFHQYMPKNPVPNLGAWNFPNPAVNRDQAGHGQGKGAIGNSTRPARSPQPARKIIRIERGDGNS